MGSFYRIIDQYTRREEAEELGPANTLNEANQSHSNWNQSGFYMRTEYLEAPVPTLGSLQSSHPSRNFNEVTSRVIPEISSNQGPGMEEVVDGIGTSSSGTITNDAEIRAGTASSQHQSGEGVSLDNTNSSSGNADDPSDQLTVDVANESNARPGGGRFTIEGRQPSESELNVTGQGIELRHIPREGTQTRSIAKLLDETLD